MSRGRGKDQRKKKRDLAGEAFAEGMRLMRTNPALAAVEFDVCRQEECRFAPRHGLVVVDSDGDLHVHPDRLAEPAAWAWALAHAVLHLGFGHVPAVKGDRVQPDRHDLAARCVVVNRFLLGFTIGETPEHLPASYPTATRSSSPPAGGVTACRPCTSAAVRPVTSPTRCWCPGRAGPGRPTGSWPSPVP